ncbi:hypothetical protein [Sinorhizobium meliloti]|uniref:hypothetical protein n=1 Tax=Rhizobium meliloti TaxID=382 RepID=UPI000FDAD3E8|nr:hypothetical protein [Sinorhizobium meliloti]RVG89291.1 hypothetical protein CN219_02300 [Sinorhizobium meliloti]RVI33960.1 hypothetical protein CN197_16945 [Sinorhizobium meliloti]RVI45068.1 hypothetical protein CN196_13970 [Sinorhizobium meliloti]RVJ30163.1 hypothetical protein CN177_03695 [Sinorhizobium meliloti]RVK03068.1 hypothetical protein CN170_05370 [Sinorhizobium meliloti]
MDTWTGIDPVVAEAQMRGLTRRLADIEDAMEHSQRMRAVAPDSFAVRLGWDSLRRMQSALERERLELVRHRARERITVALQGPTFENHTADLGSLGVFLIRLQKLYTSIAQAVTIGPRLRGPISKDISVATTMRFADVFPSSFGMELFVEQKFDMFGESVASSSLQTLFNLLLSSTREKEISRLSAELGPRTVNHLRHVLEDLAKSHAGFSIAWSDSSGTGYNWAANEEEIKLLKQNASRFRTLSSEPVVLEGFLIGASLLRDRFEFLTEERLVTEGKMAKAAKNDIREFFGRRCIGYFDRVVVVEAVTGEERTYYTMTGIAEARDVTTLGN